MPLDLAADPASETPMRTALLALLLPLALLASVALAADDDAPALLRLAQTAEKADRDVAKALALYARAVDAPGSPDASRDAALALARLQEERGARADALATLGLATERFASRMDEATKRLVHESMVRLLPPGSKARSPLGEVYVVRASGAASSPSSPLDDKIRDLLSRIDTAEPTVQWQVRQQIEQSIASVGREALPVLERMMFAERPERAEVAAAMVAAIGGVDALPALERGLFEGDGFTRAAALQAVLVVGEKDEAERRRLGEALDRLVADPRLQASRSGLLDRLTQVLPEAELLARHRAGGPDAMTWLSAALSRGAPGALERALELATSGGDDGRAALDQLLPLVFPADRRPPTYPPEALEVGLQKQFLAFLLDGPRAAQSIDRILRLVGGLAARTSPEDVEEPLARAWRLLATTEPGPLRNVVAKALFGANRRPPAALWADPAWAAVYFGLRWKFQPTWMEAEEDPAWWEGLFAALERIPPGERPQLLAWVFRAHPMRGTLPSPAYDARWIPYLDVGLSGRMENLEALLTVAARSGKSEVLGQVRRARGADWWGGGGFSWLRPLRGYRGPGLLDFVRETLRMEGLPAPLTGVLFGLLAESTGDEGRAEILAMARDWTHPRAVEALSNSGTALTDDDLVEIGRRVLEAKDVPDARYRSVLIARMSARHLRAAVPYLLFEFRREGLSKAAGEALDAIKAYHEKIAEFERWPGGR